MSGNSALNRTGILKLTNKYGADLAKGDTILLSTSDALAFSASGALGFTAGMVAVIVEPLGIANNDEGAVAVGVYVPRVNLDASASLHDYIMVSATVGLAHPVASMGAGVFGQVLDTGTNPPAVLFGGLPVQSTGGGGGGVLSTNLASIPNPGSSGDTTLPTDGMAIYRSDGAALQAWGPLFPLFTRTQLADWTWRNQGGAVALDDLDGVNLLAPPDASPQYRILERVLPTAPYKITIALYAESVTWRFLCGILLLDSASQKIHSIALGDYESDIQETPDPATGYSGGSSVGGTGVFGQAGDAVGIHFLQVEDDNAGNRIWRRSRNGKYFIDLLSEASNAYMTPNRYGVYVTHSGSFTLSNPGMVTILGVKVE